MTCKLLIKKQTTKHAPRWNNDKQGKCLLAAKFCYFSNVRIIIEENEVWLPGYLSLIIVVLSEF